MKTYEQFSQKTKVKEDWYENGQKQYEWWYLNSNPAVWHREDGPAAQEWLKNGQKQYEKWYLSGIPHREDGSYPGMVFKW